MSLPLPPNQQQKPSTYANGCKSPEGTGNNDVCQQQGNAPIPLKEWIQRTIDSVDISAHAEESFSVAFGVDPSSWPAHIRQEMAVSSDAYLKPALRIAQSLVDQFCRAQGHGGDAGGGDKKPYLPEPGTDWSDWVVVHAPSQCSQWVDMSDLQPLPFSQHEISDPNELQDLLGSTFDEPLGGEDGQGEPMRMEDLRAEILPRPQRNHELGHGYDEMQRIYSLGLVFYEIFTGGEKHPLARPHNCLIGENKGTILDTVGPGAFNENGPIDLTHKLSIHDETGVGNDSLSEGIGNQFEGHPGVRDPRKKATRVQVVGSKASFLSPLESKGLPGPLCDLVANMLDSVNGDLSEEHAYQHIFDVASDLQLMREKPDKFLYELDVEKLSVTGLQLDEAAFGREEWNSTLQTSYHSAISGMNEFAYIAGPPGVGKSVLAQRLGHFITASGGIFLTGKFEHHQAQPFSALAAAFNDYCDKMGDASRSAAKEVVASKLKAALGGEAHHLIKVFPKLTTFIGEEPIEYTESQDSCVDAQKRLQYLVVQFVQIASTFSGAPIALFLDDVQWIDKASMSCLVQLLLSTTRSTSSERRFFFVAACREKALDGDFGSMISGLECLGSRATIVKLACMDKEATNRVVSNLLCLPPRQTRELSEVLHFKTKGLPLYFSRLLVSLTKEGSLQLSLSRRRWVWDQEQIMSRETDDDVVSFLIGTISKLPMVVQSALSTLSFLGSGVESSFIEVLQTHLTEPLCEPLEVAAAEGLIRKINGRYTFVHDKVQEAAYNMVKREHRCTHHHILGVALMNASMASGNDGMLFLSASQFNHSGPASVTDTDERMAIAKINFVAGKKSMEMSDYSSAYSFFDNGTRFLPEGHWTSASAYDLSLELFESAAKCALVVGDYSRSKVLVEEICTFAKSYDAKLDALFVKVSTLANEGDLPGCIQETKSVLEELEGDIPEEDTNNFFMMQTKSLLQGFSDDDLLGYKVTEDRRDIFAMKFLRTLSQCHQVTKPEALPTTISKMVQLSIGRGMSPLSPIALTHFGSLLAHETGDVREGYHYVKVATKLVGKFGSRAKDVLGVGTQVLCYIEPVQSAQELHLENYEASMKAGDVHSALFNVAIHASTSFWSGTNLLSCRKRYAEARRTMEEHHNSTWLAHVTQMERVISMLMDTDRGECEIDGLTAGGEQDLRKVSVHAVYTFHLLKMFTSFIFRRYDEMAFHAPKYFDSRRKSYILWYPMSAHTFFGGLVSFWCYRQTKESIWAQRGSEAVSAVQIWAEASEWNFQHKLDLLTAERHYANGDLESASTAYAASIKSARDHRFVSDEALAYELHGRFCIENGTMQKGSQQLRMAVQRYREWGATRKADELQLFVDRLDEDGEIASQEASPEDGVTKNAKLAKQFKEMTEALDGNKVMAAKVCPQFMIFLNSSEKAELAELLASSETTKETDELQLFMDALI